MGHSNANTLTEIKPYQSCELFDLRGDGSIEVIVACRDVVVHNQDRLVDRNIRIESLYHHGTTPLGSNHLKNLPIPKFVKADSCPISVGMVPVKPFPPVVSLWRIINNG